MSTVVRSLLLAVVFTVLPVGVGVAMTGGRVATPPPAYTSTALNDVDTTTMTIHRGPFCDRLPAAAVTEVLGRTATYADAYGDGDRRPVPGAGTSDTLHEYGCVFRAGGVEARAWVFAPPVTRQRAQTLLAAAKGCSRPAGAAAFGTPTAASICGRSTRTVTYRGLFGDAWLSCSLAAPGLGTATLLDRTGRWCVAVARAAAA